MENANEFWISNKIPKTNEKNIEREHEHEHQHNIEVKSTEHRAKDFLHLILAELKTENRNVPFRYSDSVFHLFRLQHS